MVLRIFQKGFNYSQDGPGNRLVYHMQGCGMKCPWCANPEGLAMGGGRAVEMDDLLAEIARSRSMFFDGGGVTFTGGEPTAQFEALKALLTAIRAMSVNTAIETNGSHPRLGELLGLIDHLMIDFKQPFDGPHREITGVPLAVVMDNLALACATHPHVVVHIPMVNGYNASDVAVEGFARALSALEKRNVGVEPLWYHEYGREKWEKLGLPYTVKDGFIPDERKRAILRIFRDYGLNLVRT